VASDMANRLFSRRSGPPEAVGSCVGVEGKSDEIRGPRQGEKWQLMP
jgi:hypothetical protein